ncbi:MAG: hypothetical protein M1820_010654 [Bogoriella megaspora]|nr:MAG: hypothetical protein M1820_010654 [Bogoriella megaspora]
MTGAQIDPYLTISDRIVLNVLINDPLKTPAKKDDAIAQLCAINEIGGLKFQPTIFTTWDETDLHPLVNRYLVQPYSCWAQKVVRHPTDVVFLTYIITYFIVSLPSACFLFHHFTYTHGLLHVFWTLWSIGSFTLMMHNHIHNNGVLSKNWAWFDLSFPYILEPLMGHTWNSYYYHHVKHHHVEGNGPDDLSSTVRYQRDDFLNFLCYVGRFLLLAWLELPLYFLRKGKPVLAFKAGATELASYGFLYFVTAHVNSRASLFVFLIPFAQLRLGLMIGNWGQHALVDELEPDSDFRSSTTLIDVPQIGEYSKGRALVFHNIDFLMMTIKLLQKDYEYLANCLVPIGDQAVMSQQELADMLRTKTKRFTEEDIKRKFKPSTTSASARKWTAKSVNVYELPRLRVSEKVE